jgi:hypothetical protein
MQALETDAEISADGSVRLLSPLPDWLKPGRRRLWLMVGDQSDASVPAKRRAPAASAEMISRRKAAYAELRMLGGLSDVIPDPVAWQRETRADRDLPGRE